MLIESPFKLNDVITLKMVGGDEVVGRLNDERMEDYIELSKPMLVMMAQEGFGLMPYILTAGLDTKAKIDRSHVISYVKTFDQVAKEYMKQTTGLIT